MIYITAVENNASASTEIVQLTFNVEEYQKLLDMLINSGGNPQKPATSIKKLHMRTCDSLCQIFPKERQTILHFRSTSSHICRPF